MCTASFKCPGRTKILLGQAMGCSQGRPTAHEGASRRNLDACQCRQHRAAQAHGAGIRCVDSSASSDVGAADIWIRIFLRQWSDAKVFCRVRSRYCIGCHGSGPRERRESPCAAAPVAAILGQPCSRAAQCVVNNSNPDCSLPCPCKGIN